jgi:hydrogenase expression/formation protein HypC
MCLAVPGRVIEFQKEKEGLSEGPRMGKIDFGGIAKSICLDLVPEVRIGDYVVVHVGFAISILDEKEAEESLRLFSELEAFQLRSARGDPGMNDPR